MSLEPDAVPDAFTRDPERVGSVAATVSHAASPHGSNDRSRHLLDAGSAVRLTDRTATSAGDSALHLATGEQQTSPANAESEASAYQPAATEELLPPPDFRPFFTLIEDPDTAEHHHPTVHYVFSDDDPDILTSATLDALDTHVDAPARSELQEGEAEQRYIILDLAPDGKTVTAAASLTPQWQAIKTRVSQAPSWGDESQGADRRLMLNISGREMEGAGSGNRRKKSKVSGLGLDELVNRFGQRLDGFDQRLDRPITDEIGDKMTQ